MLGLSLLGAAGCGAPEADEVQSVESAITGDWTPLSFINGWEAYGGTTPGIGVVNGVVTFRGAIKAPVGSANSAAFLFPSALLPDPAAGVYMRTVVSGNLGAAVFINPFVAQTPVSILQDGVGLTGLGAAARTFTSLDGLSFDRVGGDPIVHDDAVWDAVYRFREHEHGCNTCGAYVKDVDGFVRLQGLLTKHVQSNYDGYLFTLPAKYVPGQMVMVPANFGGGTASTPRASGPNAVSSESASFACCVTVRTLAPVRTSNTLATTRAPVPSLKKSPITSMPAPARFAIAMP